MINVCRLQEQWKCFSTDHVFYLQLIYLLLTLSLRKASAGDERQEEDVAHGLGGDAPEENATSWNTEKKRTTSHSRTRRAESKEGDALLRSDSSVHVRRSQTFFVSSSVRGEVVWLDTEQLGKNVRSNTKTQICHKLTQDK